MEDRMDRLEAAYAEAVAAGRILEALAREEALARTDK